MQFAHYLGTIACLLIVVGAIDQAERMQGGAESLMRREKFASQIGDSSALDLTATRTKEPVPTFVDPTFVDGDFEAATIKDLPGGPAVTHLLEDKDTDMPPLGWNVNCGSGHSGIELVANSLQNSGTELVENGVNEIHSGVYVSMSKQPGQTCRIAQLIENFNTEKQYLVTFKAAYGSDVNNRHQAAHDRSNYGGVCKCPNEVTYNVGVSLSDVTETDSLPCMLGKSSCNGGEPSECRNIPDEGTSDAVEVEDRRAKTAYTVDCAPAGSMKIQTKFGKILSEGAVDNGDDIHHLSVQDLRHKNLDDFAFVMQPNQRNVLLAFENIGDDTKLYVDKFSISECQHGGSTENTHHNVERCEGV